jgi:hypothetical protein
MWWLISETDATQVGLMLNEAIHLQHELCERDGCLCALGGRRCEQDYIDALHTLDSGLHQTDAVPADWRSR